MDTIYNNKPFSFNGKIGRLGYLLYGITVPIILFLVSFYIIVYTDLDIGAFAIAFIGIIIMLASAIKRIRDRGENPTGLIIFLLIPAFTFIGMLYLLLMPERIEKVDKNTSKASYIVLIVFAVILIGGYIYMDYYMSH